MNIQVTNLQRKSPISVFKIQAAVRHACRTLKYKPLQLSIVFVGEQRMRSLNRKHLGHDYVTDVLTFAHGEIVICPAVAKRNAKSYNNSIEREILLYVVHGILHLCGYDDHSPQDIQRMRLQEQRILAKV